MLTCLLFIASVELTEVSFADGSVLMVTMQTFSIDVDTRYGKLKIPMHDIDKITFGIRRPRKWEGRQPDEIRTKTMILRGHITSQFTMTCEALGQVTPRAGAMTIMRLPKSSRMHITMRQCNDAPGRWIATGQYVDRSLQISASGSIDMWNEDQGKWLATPDGMRDPINGALGPAGALWARVGDGKEFRVGSKWTGEVSTGGILYLQIIPPPWTNAVSTGQYVVEWKGR